MDLDDLEKISPLILPMTFMLAALAIVCVTTIICVFLIIRGRRKKVRKQDADETRLVQEIHQEVFSLANRIDALETTITQNQLLSSFHEKTSSR